MIEARASCSKVYLYFMEKGRQARHRIPRNSCLFWQLPGDFSNLACDYQKRDICAAFPVSSLLGANCVEFLRLSLFCDKAF